MILKKGYKTGMVFLQDINAEKLRAVFFPKDELEKYKYLGYMYPPYDIDSIPYILVMSFVEKVDNEAKKWWCPRWFLRLLHLFGNDNSIVRVRKFPLHNLHRKLTKGLFFTDMKTKRDDSDIRIYGSFTNEMYDELRDVEEKIERHYEINNSNI